MYSIPFLLLSINLRTIKKLNLKENYNNMKLKTTSKNRAYYSQTHNSQQNKE